MTPKELLEAARQNDIMVDIVDPYNGKTYDLIPILEAAEKMAEALGQIINMADDCQQMTRHAANVFTQLADSALAQWRGLCSENA